MAIADLPQRALRALAAAGNSDAITEMTRRSGGDADADSLGNLDTLATLIAAELGIDVDDLEDDVETLQTEMTAVEAAVIAAQEDADAAGVVAAAAQPLIVDLTTGLAVVSGRIYNVSGVLYRALSSFTFSHLDGWPGHDAYNSAQWKPLSNVASQPFNGAMRITADMGNWGEGNRYDAGVVTRGENGFLYYSSSHHTATAANGPTGGSSVWVLLGLDLRDVTLPAHDASAYRPSITDGVWSFVADT